MIAYRDATAGDAARLNAMAQQSFVETFGDAYRPEDMADYLGDAYGPDGLVADMEDPAICFRIATEGLAIVGFAKLSALTQPVSGAAHGAMELRQLYVLKGWHGRGVAQQLMDWTITLARRVGAPELYLAVVEFNHRARTFYARHGFVEVGAFPYRFGERVDMDRIWRLVL